MSVKKETSASSLIEAAEPQRVSQTRRIIRSETICSSFGHISINRNTSYAENEENAAPKKQPSKSVPNVDAAHAWNELDVSLESFLRKLPTTRPMSSWCESMLELNASRTIDSIDEQFNSSYSSSSKKNKAQSR